MISVNDLNWYNLLKLAIFTSFKCYNIRKGSNFEVINTCQVVIIKKREIVDINIFITLNLMITNYVYQRLKMLKFLKLNDILRSYSVLGQN